MNDKEIEEFLREAEKVTSASSWDEEAGGDVNGLIYKLQMEKAILIQALQEIDDEVAYFATERVIDKLKDN